MIQQKVLFPFKIDLDVLIAAIIRGVTPEMEFLRFPDTRTPDGRAQLQEYLGDPEVWTFECGWHKGSSIDEEIGLNNFDHHPKSGQMAGVDLASATKQVWQMMGFPIEWDDLVKFVDLLDLGGLQAIQAELEIRRLQKPEVSFSDLVAGAILLAGDERWPNSRLVSVVSQVTDLVVGNDATLDVYADFSDRAKEEPFKMLWERKRHEDVETLNAALNVVLIRLPSGRTLGVLTSRFRGATQSCYNAGGDYCLCVTPMMGGQGRKMTFGVNTRTHPQGDLTEFLNAVNAIEPGAGGPTTKAGFCQVGGSAAHSRLELNTVIEIAKEHLK